MADTTATGARWRTMMVAAQGGDRAAYASLLSEMAPFLRRALSRRYGYQSAADIEDVVQEVLLAVHMARATYDPARPFLPWLLSIAHNRAIDSVRRSVRRGAREVAVDEYPETSAGDGTNLDEEPYGDAEALRLAVAALPAGQRAAIEMMKLKEMTLKEASEKSGMSVAALKVAVHRATRTLRVALRGTDRGNG